MPRAATALEHTTKKLGITAKQYWDSLSNAKKVMANSDDPVIQRLYRLVCRELEKRGQ